MGPCEQKEERGVLYSIFPDEITDISDISYRISIALEVTQQDGDDLEPPPLLLSVTYPPEYPDEAPILDLSAPPNSARYSHLDIQEDKARLLSALDPIIEENIGMAMVFTLVSTLKDGAELLISERQAAAQAIKDLAAAQAEEEENKKFHGTAVTRESFLEWRVRFRKEMEEEESKKREDKEAEDKKRKVKAEERLTGKQLWEKGLVGKLDEDEDEGPDGLEAIERLKVEA
ncbi:MAG: RWD domain-containing [Lasallia pustulata]|uniref:RWD domain-containing n=1 Tax=Lasallia pustulata TaxID=136370 RepID=A0A5M8PBV6_9LECA|nr:MAG: RWD domain-containing [Lasallia pustulata]